ncbi:MAG: hypothetical protein KGN36_05605 [Acidobacteriota bacterium]|nr:hypothetical protein [Acidobacteriota bacterium]
MTGEYLLRLLALSLAAFFLVQLAVGAAALAIAPCVLRAASRMRSRAAARTMLWLRWAPAIAGLLVVGAVCVPSYLRYEPGNTGEELGAFCVAGAVLALAVWTGAAIRGIRRIALSRRRLRGGVDGRGPLVAMAGFLRPRLMIAPAVVEALSPEQLDAALRHERAHGAAHDNLKRLLLAFTPGILPGVRGFARVERHWARFTEWAADDDAVAGDPRRAVALAGALVRVARLGPSSAPLASCLLDGDDLAERVERLLHPPAARAPQRNGLWSAAPALAAALAAGLAWSPAALEAAHHLLEHLVR